IAREARPYSVPVITAIQLAGRSTETNLFSVNLSSDVVAEYFARFAAEELKTERAWVVRDNRITIGTTLLEAFQRKFTAGSNRKVEVFEIGSDKEVSQFIERIQNENDGPI